MQIQMVTYENVKQVYTDIRRKLNDSRIDVMDKILNNTAALVTYQRNPKRFHKDSTDARPLAFTENAKGKLESHILRNITMQRYSDIPFKDALPIYIDLNGVTPSIGGEMHALYATFDNLHSVNSRYGTMIKYRLDKHILNDNTYYSFGDSQNNIIGIKHENTQNELSKIIFEALPKTDGNYDDCLFWISFVYREFYNAFQKSIINGTRLKLSDMFITAMDTVPLTIMNPSSTNMNIITKFRNNLIAAMPKFTTMKTFGMPVKRTIGNSNLIIALPAIDYFDHNTDNKDNAKAMNKAFAILTAFDELLDNINKESFGVYLDKFIRKTNSDVLEVILVDNGYDYKYTRIDRVPSNHKQFEKYYDKHDADRMRFNGRSQSAMRFNERPQSALKLGVRKQQPRPYKGGGDISTNKLQMLLLFLVILSIIVTIVSIYYTAHNMNGNSPNV